jgi:hypothetical protein
MPGRTVVQTHIEDPSKSAVIFSTRLFCLPELTKRRVAFCGYGQKAKKEIVQSREVPPPTPPPAGDIGVTY